MSLPFIHSREFYVSQSNFWIIILTSLSPSFSFRFSFLQVRRRRMVVCCQLYSVGLLSKANQLEAGPPFPLPLWQCWWASSSYVSRLDSNNHLLVPKNAFLFSWDMYWFFVSWDLLKIEQFICETLQSSVWSWFSRWQTQASSGIPLSYMSFCLSPLQKAS
jgi:hypothetical protein